MNKLRIKLEAYWRWMRCFVSWIYYRWKTRKTWWVVAYRTEGRSGTESGTFASLAETREDAMLDAREHIEEHSFIGGLCSFTVRRPNIIDLFFS